MKVAYLLTCLFLMLANAYYAIAIGFSHSAVTIDLGCCILVPFDWIGGHIGLWRAMDGTPTYSCIIGMWLLTMIVGLCLTKKGRSSFWALLLPPGISIMTFFVSQIMGWDFG